MFLRYKEAKYSQISICHFFGRQHENRYAIACSKILRKMVVFCKSYKNTLIRVFLHAEFISALKTEPKPTVFEKYAENRKKICYHYFLFFVIFAISFKQNFLKPNESCLLDRKKPNIAKLVYIYFFGRQHENRHAIACSKILRKIAVFSKSYKNTLIAVFLHAEFISALKMETKPTVFEKYAENRKKKFVIIIFYFL